MRRIRRSSCEEDVSQSEEGEDEIEAEEVSKQLMPRNPLSSHVC